MPTESLHQDLDKISALMKELQNAKEARGRQEEQINQFQQQLLSSQNGSGAPLYVSPSSVSHTPGAPFPQPSPQYFYPTAQEALVSLSTLTRYQDFVLQAESSRAVAEADRRHMLALTRTRFM